MKKKQNSSKSDFVALFLSTVDNDSYSTDAAKEFLSSEGYSADNIVSDGLRKIKQMQMQIEAKKTEEEMNAKSTYKAEAETFVTNLLKSIDFSLPAFVQEEQLSVSFRNIESLKPGDIKDILINHFTLKFMNRDKK